jgi:hypothetical protein
MINIDRYQLYAYHHRNYSYNAQRLLQKIGTLQNQKGMLFRQKIKDSFTNYAATLKNIFERVRLKAEYFDYHYLEDEDLNSFLRDFLTFSFPIVVVIYCTLHCLFRLVRNWAVSRILREFAFSATLLLALSEGTLEEVTFHCFAELRFLLSRNFSHKIFNFVAILVLFAVMFTCFAFFLWLRVQYAKKAKIIADTETSTLSVLASIGFDRGVMMFLFGATHQLLLEAPTLQMSLLIFLETVWILKKIYYHKHFKQSAIFVLIMLDSILRIYFQCTTLNYDLIAKNRLIIN